MFGDIMGMLGKTGPDAWFETARTLSLNVARGAEGDPNPDPALRARVEDFAPLIARHLTATFSLATEETFECVNRSTLADDALTNWRPLIEPFITASAPALPEAMMTNPLVGQLASVLGPLMTGFQLGSVAGHFSENAWSLAAVPLPRQRHDRHVVVNNVEAFATAWSLDVTTALIFALAQEMVASEFLTQPGTTDALRAVLLDATRESLANQGDIMTKLAGMVNPDDLASLMGSPESLLGSIDIPEETAANREVNAAVAVLRAVFDYVALWITEQIVGPAPLLREAYRRYLLNDAHGEEGAAALFGITLRGPHQELALTFVDQVAEKYGIATFSALLRADGLPRHEELPDAHQWVTRVNSSPLA